MELLNTEHRVALGVIHLDENYPGWRDKVNVDTFDIRSMFNCLLGQILGHYNYHRESEKTIYRCGFDATYFMSDAEDYGTDVSKWTNPDTRLNEQYEDLQAEWLKVLNQ